MNLIHACLRRCFSPAWGTSEVSNGCANVNWTHLLWLARRSHGLLFVAEALRTEAKNYPVEIRNQLEAYRECNLLNGLARVRELCRLHDKFTQSGVTPVIASNVAFAQCYWDPPELREVGPKSLFYIQANERPRAEEVLRELGYKSVISSLELSSTERSWIYLREKLGDRKDTSREILHDARAWDVGTRRLLVPSPAGWLLHLCWQAQRQQWSDLRSLYDIGVLLKKTPSLDWNEIWERALRVQLTADVIVSVALSCRTAKLELPTKLAQEMQRAPALARFVERLTSDHPQIFGWRQTLADQVRRQPTPWRKILYCGQEIRRRIRSRDKYDTESENALTPYGLYTPTPPVVADAMLDLAEVRHDDIVCDLGCGDGRIVTLAAEKFGCRGIGIDSDAKRISEAQALARRRGLHDRVTFIHRDLLQTSIRGATVVCIYLQGFVYEKVRRKIEREAPGCRVVSHDFTFSRWLPEKTAIIRASPLRVSQIYLWRLSSLDNRRAPHVSGM